LKFDMPKVSVIIPCYNLGQYLDEAVESVLAQTFQDFEIIIVNDGSTDEFTNKLLANYNKPKTKVLTTENQGLPSARNNGIKISGGEYICCLDADDKYHPEFLAKTAAVLDNEIKHKLGFVTTWVQIFDESTAFWETSSFNPTRLAVENIVHVASLFRRECWEKKGGYSTNLSGYQDWDFWIAVAAMGYEWVCIDEILFYYRVRSHSMVKASDEKRAMLIRQIVKNNRDFYLMNYEEIFITSIQQLVERDRQLEGLHKQLETLHKQLEASHNSYSCRITSPLRGLFNILSKLRQRILNE